MNFLEGNMDLSGLFIIIGLIMFGPPILFAIIGAAVRKKSKTASKIFYILAVLYLIIGLGICGSMLT